MRKRSKRKKTTGDSSVKKTSRAKNSSLRNSTRGKIVERIKRSVKKVLGRKKNISKKSKVSEKETSSPLLKMVNSEKEKVEISKFAPVGVLLKEPKEVGLKEEKMEFRLPSRYYDNRIVLLPRDPWWLHTYWDIAESKLEEVKSLIPFEEKDDLRWVLRVYNVEENSYFDLDIIPEACNWYINVNKPETTWYVDIGLKTRKGNFFLLASSNKVKTPYFGISTLQDEEWVLPEEEYYKILGLYDLGRSSLERRKKLEEFLKYGISSGAFSPGISSLFSIGIRKQYKRKFFLEVATELILYGRTEPDAELTVAGKKVKLNRDGTFSLRYMLPEGNFEFPVEAVSQDKKDRIKITPVVSRSTK